MPPKRHYLLKPKAKGKAKAQEPQSENDFLEAADEHEAAAGKWRAGDVAKATRFFNRAIDMYNEGLKRYPHSFDLAYNKANLEYNITEDDRIVSQFGNRTALLEETLTSHRFAASLNPNNLDIQFNTAQVLTSLAEAMLAGQSAEVAKVSAWSLLEEAVDIFTKCLEAQQNEYAQWQAEFARVDAEQGAGHEQSGSEPSGQEDAETKSTSSNTPGEWATVEEAITPETLLETCTAQLGALTTLLGLYNPSDSSTVTTRYQMGLDTVNLKIPYLLDLVAKSPHAKTVEEPSAGPTLSLSSTSAPEETQSTPKDDALLAAGNFQASMADVTYRSGHSTSIQYAQTIEQIFANLDKLSEDGDASRGLPVVHVQSAYADALMDLASAIADTPSYPTSSKNPSSDLETQWTALTQAQTILTKLSTGLQTSTLSASRLADIFLARGDVDLFRFRISLLETAKPAWINSKTVSVANAGVFYRGARSYAEKASATEVRSTADAKAIVAEVLKEVASGSGVKKDHWKGRSADVVRVLEQMVEEGIIGRENIEGVAALVE